MPKGFYNDLYDIYSYLHIIFREYNVFFWRCLCWCSTSVQHRIYLAYAFIKSNVDLQIYLFEEPRGMCSSNCLYEPSLTDSSALPSCWTLSGPKWGKSWVVAFMLSSHRSPMSFSSHIFSDEAVFASCIANGYHATELSQKVYKLILEFVY